VTVPKNKGLCDFANALREALDLDPLYQDGRCRKDDELKARSTLKRFYRSWEDVPAGSVANA